MCHYLITVNLRSSIELTRHYLTYYLATCVFYFDRVTPNNVTVSLWDMGAIGEGPGGKGSGEIGGWAAGSRERRQGRRCVSCVSGSAGPVGRTAWECA